MNLPQLTAKIGRAAKTKRKKSSELSMLVKEIRSANSSGNDYLVFMTFDLDKNEIRFEDPVPMNNNTVFDYHYFGNNSAAGMQYYVTRECSSIHYLLKSVFSDLVLVLQKHGFYESELLSLLSEIDKQGLINLCEKKGGGIVYLDKIKHLDGATLDEKNNVVIDGAAKKGDEFLRYLLQWEGTDVRFSLIVPRIVKESKSVVIPLHPDYIAVTKKEQNIENPEGEQSVQENLKFCYVCNKAKTNVSSELTTKFSRSGINKIFGTTTFNYAKGINKKYYDDSYAMCGSCFQDMLFGEKEISKSFSLNIAGERAFVLPEGLLDDFRYDKLSAIKKGTDLFFEKGITKEIESELEVAVEIFERSEEYVVHFFIYKTDGNSVTVLETIEDVPTLHIIELVKELGRQAERLSPYIRSLSLGAIYRMIPVRTNKKKEQLDIQRVLTLYHSLFSKTTIDAPVLFEYATEALEKGFKEIRKKQIIQYENMGLHSFLPDQEDRYFRQVTMRYICLLQTCQKLGILDREVFYKKGGKVMDLTGMTSSVQEIHRFLDKQGFRDMPRALFYLGTLVRNVARAQYEKNHKSKPILNKIQFQGMNQKEIIRLYQDVLEKLNQYNKVNMENEQLIKAFNHYFGTLEIEKALSDQEHIFYLMAGYSFYPAKLKGEAEEQRSYEDTEDEESITA